MLPSLADVLDLDVCRRGRPAVLAGADRLGTSVRWVHAIELTDVVGLDISLNVGKVLSKASNREVPESLTKRVQEKKLGRKSGEGFYHWQDGKAQKAAAGPEAPDLEDRLILPMLNEAIACLREATVADADLLDAGAVFATGFAPFRGGPLQYAKDRNP